MNELIKQLQNRRSVREFTGEKLKEEDLQTILETAQRAANSINGQQTSLIVIRDKEKLAKIAELCGGQKHIAQAEAIVAVRKRAGIPAVPNVHKRIMVSDHYKEDTDRREDQHRTEDRVHLADDLINREDRRNVVIHEDNAVDNPGRRIFRTAREAENLRCRNVTRRVDKDGTDQKQTHRDKDVINPEDLAVRVLLDHIRHLDAAVSRTDHAREVVVHRAADHIADRNGEQGNRPEEYALNRPEYGTGSRNVQKVNQRILPSRHRNKVHTVLLRIRRGLAVIRAEDALTEGAVQKSAADQNREANHKCCHNCTSLSTYLSAPPGGD